MQDVVKSVIEFSKTRTYPKGFYAGDGSNWFKFENYEAAESSKLRYIIFVQNDEATIYKC